MMCNLSNGLDHQSLLVGYIHGEVTLSVRLEHTHDCTELNNRLLIERIPPINQLSATEVSALSQTGAMIGV